MEENFFDNNITNHIALLRQRIIVVYLSKDKELLQFEVALCIYSSIKGQVPKVLLKAKS